MDGTDTGRGFDPSAHPHPAVTVDVILFTIRERELSVHPITRRLNFVTNVARAITRGDWSARVPGASMAMRS